MSEENEGLGQQRKKRSVVELYDNVYTQVNPATQAKCIFLYTRLKESNWYSHIEVAGRDKCLII